METKKQKICPICNKRLTFLKETLKDGVKVCSNHVTIEAGLLLKETIEQSTVEDIKERIELIKSGEEEAEKEINNFVKEKQIGDFIAFDDGNQKWALLSSFQGKVQQVYDYSDIIDFELLEDGNSVASGGLGRALVGGALFGGAGAIVGAVTGKKKKKSTCTALTVKVTINDINNPSRYIHFIDKETKKNSNIYGIAYNQAQECMSTLQLICDERHKSLSNEESINNKTDQVLEYKKLLDAGAITEEEYNSKKKELLGL